MRRGSRTSTSYRSRARSRLRKLPVWLLRTSQGGLESTSLQPAVHLDRVYLRQQTPGSTRIPLRRARVLSHSPSMPSKTRVVLFSLDSPIPYDLIGRIVKFRVTENLDRAATKEKKK